MKKKKPQPVNPIETYVEEVVKKVLDSRDDKLKKKDAEEIVKAILPEIEGIVSKIVLEHFKALATYIQTNFRDPEGT